MLERMVLGLLMMSPYLAVSITEAQQQVPASTPRPLPAAQPRQATVPLTQEGISRYLADYDSTLAALRSAIKRWDAARDLPMDFRNTTARRDVLRYALPEDIDERMKAQRARAQLDFDGGDWPGVRAQLAPAVVELNAATERLVGIVSYWRQRVVHDRRMKAWARTVRANGLADPHGPELAQRETALNGKVIAGQFPDAARNDLPSMLALFVKALDEARAASPVGALIDDPLRRLPKKPCNVTPTDVVLEAAPGESDGAAQVSAPRIQVQRSKPTFSFYPPLARMLGIEGLVKLRVLIAPTGCVVWAEMTDSSNVSVLDEAGMDWAVNGAVFTPGMVGNRPVATRSQFNVRFKLN